MKPLAIYFNEKSLQGTLTNEQWGMDVENLFHVLHNFLQLRRDGEIIFVDDALTLSCGGIPLVSQFGKLKNQRKTEYVRFISKIKKVKKNIELLRDIQWSNQVADGLTQASLNDSWCFSFPSSHPDWLLTHIRAQCDEIDDAGNFKSRICEIRNLADQKHLIAWREAIEDWGAIIAASAVLDSLKGHDVVMYSAPREHNPPHVHVLHKGSGETLAKYRIEDGAREDGKPTLDTEMRVWLTSYKEQLLRSWDRCQRGGHPYQLDKNT